MIHLIGDLQGCDEALARLLDTIGFSPSRDRVVLLGDLVNRGPGSLAVLQRLVALGDAAACVLGNHDLHLLAVAHGTRTPRRGDTVDAILNHPERAAWIDWLRAQPLARMEAGWLCVHAGVVPQWTAQQTLLLAGEVQALLRGPDCADFLAVMYGNEPAVWSEDLQGSARWRFIVNVLTRIRLCSEAGVLDLKIKEAASAAPPGLRPWFDVPGRRTADQPMAFGHWSTLGLINRPGLLALDTGCVWGGCLSAMRVDGGRRELLQVRCSASQEPERSALNA
jgi:bis(5'-nucleosyl)-tetraphosphatase (symmetrical)